MHINYELGPSYYAEIESMILLAKSQGLSPVWGLSYLAARIASRRHGMEWVYTITLARERTTEGLILETEDAMGVFDWLVSRWALQIWSERKPKRLGSAKESLGKIQARCL